MLKHDQLIGLCDEIAALARLNVPLEDALLQRSRDLPQELGNRIRELAEKLENGQSLREAIRADNTFPPAYAAVIEAGLESGNLAGALELVAKNVRLLRDSRHFLISATLYPMFVFSILWIVLSGVLCVIGPAFAHFYRDFEFTLPVVGPVFDKVELFSESNPYGLLLYLVGMFLVPVALWAIYGHWCYHSSRSLLLTFRPPSLFFWLRSANRDLARSTFAQVTALLIRSHLPLNKALWLATRTVDAVDTTSPSEPRLSGSGDAISEDGPPGTGLKLDSPLAPLVRWIRGIPDQQILLSGLEKYADMCTFRAKGRLDRLELWLPMFSMFLLGGAVCAAYFCTIIFPYGYLLYKLTGQ